MDTKVIFNPIITEATKRRLAARGTPVIPAWARGLPPALKIAGDYHPKGLIPTDYDDNPLHFGLTYPFIYEVLPEMPFYYAIPKLERPYLIWGEIGMLVVKDSGVAVAADDLIACITGTRIEMRG